jgi:hypothetical protein
VPLRVEGAGVGVLVGGASPSTTIRVAEPEMSTATWEFDVQAEDREGAKRAALDALRAEVGEEAFEALWRDLDDWNATPRQLQGPQADEEEAKGGG